MKKENILRGASYLLVAVLAAFLTLAVGQGREETTKLEELQTLIEEKYIGGADSETLENAAADAMVSATGDRWSYYISADEYQSYQEQMANAYVGIGVTIQEAEEDQGFVIVSVTAGGPAEEVGIQVQDLLIMVDGQDVRGMEMDQVRALVRGEVGSHVSLTLMRQGETTTVSVERRQVQTVVAEQEMLSDHIGLVTIYNFDSRCADETIAAIETLLEGGARKLIFDVRNNPGGYASELVEVLDYLLPEGEVFHTVSYDGKESVDQSDPDCLEVPMAVLVNGSSYSAAEFFAAALQEYEAAVVVGTQTSGKGYFQNTYELGDGSAVALSVGKYYTPQGKNLEGVGITPDVEVSVDEETENAIYYGILAPEEDPQIQAAVQALEES